MRIGSTFILAFLLLHFVSISKNDGGNNVDSKEKAFQVLVSKCNLCHIRKNKTRVYSLDNMDSLAPLIHDQVFVRKRMPKGRKNKLSSEEVIILKKWLKSLGIE